MDSKAFAEQFLLKEVEQMKAANVRLHLLSAMVHGIETAGALLDPLPFKAKGQGKKRFGLALHKLFPAVYDKANRQLDLYSQLRSHMAHCMLPAKTIIISDKQHLHISENGMDINLDVFFDDYRSAINLLIELLESGKLKNKKIVFDNLGLLE
ncbi:MAG: hypothetical protein KBF73_12580, partial [Flavobacteriales bacterium]|nr:hypothetical protein [Flavobacteriales bacterium]